MFDLAYELKRILRVVVDEAVELGEYGDDSEIKKRLIVVTAADELCEMILALLAYEETVNDH